MFAAEITPPTSPTRISNISNLELEIWQPEGYTRRLSPAARDRDKPRGYFFGIWRRTILCPVRMFPSCLRPTPLHRR